AQGVDQGSSPTPRVEPNGPTHPVFIALAETVRRHGGGGGEHQSGGAGPPTNTPFDRLIQAFELDQTLHHYQTWDQLVHYCTLSADPVGRIVLALAGYADTPENAQLYAMSDATCTALQLTNHWQDVRRDLLEKDRIYVPSADTGVTPEVLKDWATRTNDPEARIPYIKMMRELVIRTNKLYEKGKPLASKLDRGIGPVVWLFGAGGRSVLRAIERGGCTTLWKRPTLTPSVKAWLLARAWITTRLH
ncbi:MAG: squalene/phytoene synthase family protein, partial [Pyrinomonadaceae bacterium]|nr:squalene/phytoene synthase family protein [Phycisphaerales bacterium]